jgi:cytosine deaminase
MRHRDIALPLTATYLLRRALIPTCFLPRLAVEAPPRGDGCALVDLEIERGLIARIAPAAHGRADENILDLEGRQVWPRLVDMHTHLDKGEVAPRANADGTLDGGANATAADRRFWTPDDLRARMDFAIRCAYAQGVSAIRTHLDSNHDGVATAWSVFNELREEWAGRVLLQGVGLVPLPHFTGPLGVEIADLVTRHGGVLGAVTDAIGTAWSDPSSALDRALDSFLTIAAERDLDVDLHVDQTASVGAFALPHIARAVMRGKFAGQVVCGHCVNLSLQPEAIIQETAALCREANIGIVTLPAQMMYLMDRSPLRTPRWRGVTAGKELLAAGVPLAVAGDNCRDAWFPYGNHDMVETFQQGVKVLQLDHPIANTPATVGPIPAALMKIGALGSIVAGEPADLILFSARTLDELMSRPQSDRIVVNRGVGAQCVLPDYSELDQWVIGKTAVSHTGRRDQ